MKAHKILAKTILLSGLFLFSANLFSRNPNFHIYLCFGQSNMEGQGSIEAQDKTVDGRFKVLQAVDCSALGRTKGQWYPAIPPLCQCGTGLSPADYFGRTMVKYLPDSIMVGVINVAVGGCDIRLFDKDLYQDYDSIYKEEWYLSKIRAYDGNPRKRLMEMAKLAQQYGVVKGILMHQGETNSGNVQWPTYVKKVYEDILSELGLSADSVPLLVGEVLSGPGNCCATSMNPIIDRLPNTIPTAYVISSKDLTGQDAAHFDSPSYRELGKRYAEKMLALLSANATFPESKSQDSERFFPKKDLISTGIYYYPEHWPEHQWERDIKKIADMGYEFVHLAEFAWYKMEPVKGHFDFDWLDRVVKLCEKYYLKIVMCTPSATTPTWMRLKYPETFIMDGHYIRAENGTRGLGSVVNKKYRAFTTRIVTEMAKRYGQNNAVIGWQVDNEPPAVSDFSPASQEAFRSWLKAKYKTIDELNRAWGAAFWSQWFSDFSQVVIPNTNLVGWWGNNPHAILDFKRYEASAQADFLDLQAGTLRKYISSNQYITTNYTAVCTGADASKTKKLDFATYTAYPNGGSDNLGDKGFRLGNGKVILFASEFYKAVGGVSGVMEIQPGPVNWGSYNPLLLPGTVRMWLYHSFAAGGKLACSYRFRQILYSSEQYHSGVISTDGVTPSPGGYEYMQFMKEIKELRKVCKPDAKMPEKLAARSTAILWNLENYWTIDRQKQTWQWDTWNYPVKFLEITKSLGAPTDVIPETADFSKYNVLIVPAYELADSSLVKKWTEYAMNGGNLILTCRTASKDRDGHFWEGECAAPISGLIGAHVKATDMLSGYAKGSIVMKGSNYSWNNWADLLDADSGTDVLATYDNQLCKGKAAVVRRSIGKGSVTYIGVDTDDSKLEKDILRTVYQGLGATTENYPEGVYVYWRDGFYVAVNYSSNDYKMNLPASARIFVGEATMKPADVLVWSE